jgi:signal transduction histidine kinase
MRLGALLPRLGKNPEGFFIFSETSAFEIRSSLCSASTCHSSMNWITVFWSMNAGACLTLAALYGGVWYKQARSRAGADCLRPPNIDMWEWDFEKDEVWMTPTCRVQSGFPAFGRITFEDLICRWHAEDRDEVRRVVNETIRNGKDYQVEFRVLCADGKVRWVYSHGRLQLDHRRNSKRLTEISFDITGRKEAEILARKQREGLEKIRQRKNAFLERELAERSRVDREVIESCGREQRRIAYDLHDGVGQQLVSIALSAKLLEEQLRLHRPCEAEKASAIVKLAQEAAMQTRLTARNVEGAETMSDLKTALESLAVNISHNSHVEITVISAGASLPISAPVAAQLYRIAQEAVRNAVEHGAAREVLIQLTFGDCDMVLTVRDDGDGFNIKANGRGMGLRIMRYRAQCIGGSCEVRPAPNRGTVICCRVPLQAQPSFSTMS